MTPALTKVCALGVMIIAYGLASPSSEAEGPRTVPTAHLKGVFPRADSFRPGEGDYPHFQAWKDGDGESPGELLGFVLSTAEVTPDEYAYFDIVDVLVGFTTSGIFTGVRVVEHREPFGYFSIDLREFEEQFSGKSILDPLREGRDIDIMVGATITVEGTARIIRKSVRQIARQHVEQTRGE